MEPELVWRIKAPSSRGVRVHIRLKHLPRRCRDQTTAAEHDRVRVALGESGGILAEDATALHASAEYHLIAGPGMVLRPGQRRRCSELVEPDQSEEEPQCRCEGPLHVRSKVEVKVEGLEFRVMIIHSTGSVLQVSVAAVLTVPCPLLVSERPNSLTVMMVVLSHVPWAFISSTKSSRFALMTLSLSLMMLPSSAWVSKPLYCMRRPGLKSG